ncbi:hypothetical protein GF339_18320, partial [candidate division KSB3 bacterium]|nr:hypothetical protein [candidate division KSB3 bacterium]
MGAASEGVSSVTIESYTMDPVTHITAGVLGAQAIRRPLRDRYFLLFCILAAWLPDIDNLIGFLGPEFYLVHHRGLTHSVL